MSEDMSERMSKDMSEDMSGEMSKRYVRRNVRKICQKICQKECQKICQKICQEKCQKDMSEGMSKDMSERMSKDMSGRMSEDKSEIMSKDMSERMSKDMSGRMSGNMVRNICQKECQKICQKEFMFARTEFCGWHLVFCFIWRTAASTVGSTLFLCKEVSLVWQPWRRLWWNVLRRSSLGLPIRLPKELSNVWRYKLTFVGAERMYVCVEPPSTTHAGDLMFIMEEVVEGNKWYVAYEGRPVPNAEGEQELEKRAAVFRTSASFWEDGVHEWETNNVRSRATYAEPAEGPQWRASDFMVCTRHEM